MWLQFYIFKIIKLLKLRLILFLAGLFFITLYSCTDLSKISTHEFSRTTPVSLSDSLLMVEKFELLLQAPNKTDSLLASASFLLEEKPELNDIYNSSYGRFLILTGQIDQARDHVNAVIQSYDTDTLHLNLAKYHNLMAAIAAYSKNHEKSVFHFKRAIMLNELHGDHRQASVIKFNLANIFFGRLDYDSAYLYANQALPALEKAKDTTNLILCLSVLAAAEINLERPKEAEQHARRALRLSEHHNNLQAQLLANYAMGEIELASGSYEVAINRLEAAIILGEQQHMLQWLLPIRAALQKTYLVNENHLEAVQVGEKLMEQATFFGNRDVMYSTLKNLALAQEKLSLYQEAFNNMKEAESLLRENMSETTERALRETLVKYETEKKNNIILQQENKISQQQIRTIWLVAFSAILILSLVMIWNHTRQKNRFLIKDKENAVFLAINEGEERERKRLAGELHDGIASNLVAIKLNLENHQTINKETDKILELLEKTHQEIRLLAHNLAPLSFENQTLAMAL